MIQNSLLAALSETGNQDLNSHLTRVSLALGQVLHQAEEEIEYTLKILTEIIKKLVEMSPYDKELRALSTTTV